MHIMYIDESGDTGIKGSPSRYFALSGLVIHELRWGTYLNQLIEFRRRLRTKLHLKLREEIHSSHLLEKPKALGRLPKQDRLAIIRMFADELATMNDLSVINVLVDKEGKSPDYDVFDNAWGALLQRFENTIGYHNFPGPRNPEEAGIIIPDNTDVPKLKRLTRKLRRYNPVPNQGRGGYRDLRIRYIIEDPNFRDSHDSYFVQAADLCAFLLYQFHRPSKYMKRKYASKYFERLSPVLCRVACPTDPYGIVRL